MKKIIILAAIILLGSIFRLYQLNNFPEGVHIDESSRSYNAYSIAKTGRDEYGKFLPVFFESEGEYKLPVNNYIFALYFKFIPMTKLTDRLLPALFSIFQIILIYYLFLLISKSTRMSLIGSFLFAASYWNINFARNSDTNQLTNFFVLLSIILFVKLVKTNMLRFVFLLFFFSSLAIFSYRTATVFLPIFLFVSFIFYFNNFKIKTKIVYIFLLVVVSIGILFSFSIILKRFNSQGVNAYPEMLSLQGEEIREDGNLGSTYVTRFFHNKVFDLTRLYSRKYFENLNPTFLFFKGDASLNNSIVNEPLFYAFEIILFSFGLYVFAKKFNKNDKLSLIFPMIILIVPLSTAPTVDNPNASRMLVSQYGFIYFISLGIMYILHFKFERLKKICLLFCVFAYFYYISYLTHEYYVHKPVHQPWFRNLGNEELIPDLEKMKNKYQKVYFDKNFVTEYLFLSQYDPVKLQERIAKFGNYSYAKKTMSILDDKYVHVGGACRFTDGEKNVLYVCSSSQIPIKSKIIKVYRFKDKQINYILLEYDKNGKSDRILPLNVSFL